MRFTWDKRKNRQNRSKHKISFELAQEVFLDPFCLTIVDRGIEDEQRFWAVGRVESLLILLVVHTVHADEGEEVIRILSARKATPRERRLYEENEVINGE